MKPPPRFDSRRGEAVLAERPNEPRKENQVKSMPLRSQIDRHHATADGGKAARTKQSQKIE
jgi:hypothetical protein